MKNSYRPFETVLVAARGALVLIFVLLAMPKAHGCGEFLDHVATSTAALPKYRTVPMDWLYWGEDRGLSLLVRWNGYQVKYLSAAESAALEVRHDGRDWRYAQSGARVVEPGFAYYLMVMDERGRIYLDGQSKDLKHSSVPRGGRVAAAGEVRFDRGGNLSSFEDATGHYYRAFSKIPGLNWRNFAAELESRGIDSTKVDNHRYDGGLYRFNVIDRIIMVVTKGRRRAKS